MSWAAIKLPIDIIILLVMGFSRLLAVFFLGTMAIGVLMWLLFNRLELAYLLLWKKWAKERGWEQGGSEPPRLFL